MILSDFLFLFLKDCDMYAAMPSAYAVLHTCMARARQAICRVCAFHF